LLELFSADTSGTATATLQTADAIVNTGTMNTSAFTAAPTQTYTSTTTAYSRTTLAFNVQSTLVANGILLIRVTASSIGTSSNLYMLPYISGL
jgi:hypothetical protein